MGRIEGNCTGHCIRCDICGFETKRRASAVFVIKGLCLLVALRYRDDNGSRHEARFWGVQLL